MKTNVIKLKFINNGVAGGKEYTYYTNINANVEVGQIVNIDGEKQGVITQINVPESEIAPFRDKAKTIMGKVNIKIGDRVNITNDKGIFVGQGKIANINEFREPSMMYAIDADFYKGDFVFAGENQLKLVEGES